MVQDMTDALETDVIVDEDQMPMSMPQEKVRAGSPAAHPTACDRSIVAETCSRLNYGTTVFFGTRDDSNTSVLHAEELAEHLMVARQSVLEFFDASGVRNP